jgi:hypothetical protein
VILWLFGIGVSRSQPVMGVFIEVPVFKYTVP